MRIASTGQPDGDDGSWVKVPVEPVRALARPVSLKEIKADPALAGMELLRQSRLSVAPVRDEEWERIVQLSES
jgi:predicted RNA-binding protein with PUA-like domain